MVRRELLKRGETVLLWVVSFALWNEAVEVARSFLDVVGG